MLESLHLQADKPIRQQITTYLRGQILSGSLCPGTKLPTTKEMAGRWGTQVANVHAALTPLVREKLLARRQGVGTVVSDPNQTLTTVAVCSFHKPGEQLSAYQHTLCEEIRRQLDAAGKTVVPIFHSAPEVGELLPMAQRGAFQAIICPRVDRERISQLQTLPVPFSCLSSARLNNIVKTPSDILIRLQVEGLLRQGCRSTGLITSMSLPRCPEESGEHERVDFHNTLQKILSEYGIECRDEWRFLAENERSYTAYERQQFGYQSIRTICRLADRPDGVIVYTDDLVSGVLLGLMNMGIRVPDDLKLVLYRNNLLDFLCPVSCYVIESDMREAASGLIQLVQDQFDGKPIKPFTCSPTLIAYHPDMETA